MKHRIVTEDQNDEIEWQLTAPFGAPVLRLRKRGGEWVDICFPATEDHTTLFVNVGGCAELGLKLKSYYNNGAAFCIKDGIA